MTTLVLGGSGSGKSTYAEDYAVSISEGRKLYYLAAMEPFGKEAMERIARHKNLRQGKGFVTIEQPTDISRALKHMEAGERTVLLECLSNLAANEMFAGDAVQKEENVAAKVVDGIVRLKEGVTHLVIVSGNLFEDGINYEPETMAYIRALGRINERLAAMADEVVEVVVGIPLVIKRAK